MSATSEYEEQRTDHLSEETQRRHDCKRENWNMCDVTKSDTNLSRLPSTSTMLSVATRRVPATIVARAALVRTYTSSGNEGSVAQSKEFG